MECDMHSEQTDKISIWKRVMISRLFYASDLHKIYEPNVWCANRIITFNWNIEMLTSFG